MTVIVNALYIPAQNGGHFRKEAISRDSTASLFSIIANDGNKL